ncbi:MAG: hypothetical protein FWD35_06555, partial [Oscillospiraceae bacterium]|nr:hypothetical protein [Oscillospiraceae bacterium]
LSEKAQAVIDSAREVYEEFYANLGSLRFPKYKITNWDAGFYQVRKSLEEADTALDELELLYEAHRKLGGVILPRIYEYGFLSGGQSLYADEDE